MDFTHRDIKIIRILVLIIIVLLILRFIPEMFNSFEVGFNTSFNVVRTLASLGTLMIAILVYDKFGANRLIKEKQILTVLEVLNTLKTSCIYAHHPKTTMFIWLSKDLKRYESQNFDFIDETEEKTVEFSNKTVLYSSMQHNYINEKIGEIVKSIYMPKSLKEEFNFLKTSPMVVITGNAINQDDYMIISSKGKFSIEKIVVGYPPSGNITFEKFLRKLENLIFVIEMWIEKHTNLKNELNLETY